MTTPNVVPLRPMTAADRLERIATRPLQPRRDELKMLATRLRALEELLAHEHDQQLQLKEVG